MKNTSGRIPKAVDSFNAYINNTESYLRLGTNWQRLGMLDTEMDSWTDFKNQWNALYPKYSDKEASRTTAITNKLRGVQDSFRTFAQRLLNMMAGMRTATDDDAATLNFVLFRSEPSRSDAPINEIPTFSATPLGGAVIKFSFRPTSDSNRAGKLEEASGIEIRYEVLDGASAGTESFTFFTSTKSVFNLTLPKISKGKTLLVSARWIIASNPGRNGPWSSTLSVVVA